VNYLELCKDFVAEYGLSGGTGPATVANQVGELRNVTRWIADANDHVNNLWLDWKFLWREYSGTANINSATPSSPAETVRLWDNNAFELREAGGEWVDLPYRTRREIRDAGRNATANRPGAITILPTNLLQFDCPADLAYEVYGQYWIQPARLAVDGDTPKIPAAYHRLIIVRAAVMYGSREDAPEIVNGAAAEWLDLKDKLEAAYLEDHERRRSSTDRGLDDTGDTLRQFMG
jgi:hypothetical protein